MKFSETFSVARAITLIISTAIFFTGGLFSAHAISEAVSFVPTELTCTDGIDNDGDFIVDEEDECPEVEEEVVEFIPTVLSCTDGIDNDGDFIVDEEDECPKEEKPFVPTELTCTDGIDNDGDFIADEDDECPEVEEEDNDPIITLVGSSTLYIAEGDVFTDPFATATDTEDGVITSYIVASGTVDTGTPGTYTITYTVTDSDDNTVSTSRTVIVTAAPETEEIEETTSRRSSGSSSGRRSSDTGTTTGEVLGTSIDTGEVLGASTCSAILSTYMRQGSPTNDVQQVMALQQFLADQGYDQPVTGFFGPITDRNVRLFQTDHLMEVLQPWVVLGYGSSPIATGYVYKTTRHTINNIHCPGSEAYPVLDRL